MGNFLRKRVTIVAMLAGAMLLAVFFGSDAIANVADSGQSGKPECMNGRDDDFDGKVDYPTDPGCSSRKDRSELDPASPLPPPPPPPPPPPTTSSWNPHVTRTPVLTTVEHVIGSQVASCGGASEPGGGFPNHLKGTEGATPGQPIPSEIPANAAFVEIDGLRLESTNRKPWGSGSDGDATTNATDPNRADISSTYMKGIHLEVSRHWGTISTPSGIVGPFLSPYPEQTEWPAPGTLVDVQGFVRWDALHVLSTSHYCSGWELHPVSAWRLHR
jgi:hypothetical protein